MTFAAIREFLKLQGIHYQAPAKAGVLASEMEQYRALAQAARKEFTDLVSAFQKRHPYLEQDRTSQWMNQAQILRPHFWAYLRGEGTMAEPMFALRLYGDAVDFGVSLEVSYRAKKRRAEPSKTTQGSHPSHHSASLLFRPEKWRESKGRGNRKESP